MVAGDAARVRGSKAIATRGPDRSVSHRKQSRVTEHGVPSAYLVDVTAFEMMQERMAILEGIACGERAILEGRTLTHTEARGRMEKWLT